MRVFTIGPYTEPIIKIGEDTLVICHECDCYRKVVDIFIKAVDIPTEDEHVHAYTRFACGHIVPTVLI